MNEEFVKEEKPETDYAKLFSFKYNECEKLKEEIVFLKGKIEAYREMLNDGRERV